MRRHVTGSLVRAHRSCGAREQPGKTNEVVGGGREGEGPVDACEAAQPGSSQARNRLDPAERFLDPFPRRQAGGIAGVACGAAIDRRVPAADVLNTLQSRTKVRVLSAPKPIVLNNQTATLQVGDQVPIVTQQSQSVALPGAPIVNSVELRDTGVILKVTPRVNDSGAVQIDIAQEVSDVTPTTTSGINSPTIQQRRLATTVATRSGQMIAWAASSDRRLARRAGFRSSVRSLS